MKLITELNEEIEVLSEGTGDAKKYFIEGVFLQGDIDNRNKRRYAMEVLRPEVSRYIREYVDAKRAFGELGHPAGPTINLDRASHMIMSLKEDGKNFIGKAKVMDTPMGKIVKNLLDEGARLGVSSRALGSLKMNSRGINEVQSDLMLATAADIVADPSAPDAFVQGIMEECEWIFENGQWSYQKLDETRQMILDAKQKQLEDIKIRVFQEYLGGFTK